MELLLSEQQFTQIKIYLFDNLCGGEMREAEGNDSNSPHSLSERAASVIHNLNL